MVLPVKTRSAVRQLGTSYWALVNLLRTGQLDPPPKDESGDFIWWPADIDRAREVIKSRHQGKAVAR